MCSLCLDYTKTMKGAMVSHIAGNTLAHWENLDIFHKDGDYVALIYILAAGLLNANCPDMNISVVLTDPASEITCFSMTM